MFPPLERYLREAFDVAPAGEVHCLGHYRHQPTNFRNILHKAILKAGVEPWPRCFHNMRASLQTELQQHFPEHVVCKWLGNSAGIARRHYLQVTEEHFKQAVVQGAVLQGSEGYGNQLQAVTSPMMEPQENAGFQAFSSIAQSTYNEQCFGDISRETGEFGLGGADDGALAQLIEVWPSLSKTTRRQILALAMSTTAVVE
jgi:hypothetical protein